MTPDTQPTSPKEAPRGNPVTPGRIFAILSVLGLVLWFGVRVRAATTARDALQAEREQIARTAQKEQSGPARARAVTAVHGAADTWLPSVPFDGTLMPISEADLGFKASGKLQTIRVRLGQKVRRGAALASLDGTEALAMVDSAGAQIRASEAQLLMAQDAERRNATLLQRGAGTPAAGMQAAQQRALATAQVDAARAQLQLAQVSLYNLTLTAPFSGFVTRAPTGTGAIVNPGVPLFHLQDLSTLRLSGTVSENDAHLCKSGARVVLHSGGTLHTGRITSVLPAVDPATRRVPVEAELPNEDGALLSGTFVHAAVEGEAAVPVLRLPAGALRPGSQDEVMVARDGRLAARRITWSPGAAGTLLVRQGLAPEDAVVLAPSSEARDGDPVQVLP